MRTLLIICIILQLAILLISGIDGGNDISRIQRIEDTVLAIQRDLSWRAISPVNVKYGSITIVDRNQITVEEVEK